MSAQEEKPVEQQVQEVDTPQSRGEKKARKALISQGLKHVNGINRVTFTRAGGIVFAIAKPDVYKSVNSDTFIVFGEMQMEDMRARAQEAAAQQLAAEAAAKADETPAAEGSSAAEAAAEEEDEEVDATGVEEKDIELVVNQANVSRNKAIKALKNNDNDIVNAIMVNIHILQFFFKKKKKVRKNGYVYRFINTLFRLFFNRNSPCKLKILHYFIYKKNYTATIVITHFWFSFFFLVYVNFI